MEEQKHYIFLVYSVSGQLRPEHVQRWVLTVRLAAKGLNPLNHFADPN